MQENENEVLDEETVTVDEDDLHPDAVEYLAGDTEDKSEFNDDYEDAKASDPVKKRIGKITRKWRDTERERDDWRSKAEESNKRIAEMEKQHSETNEEEWESQEKEIQESIDSAVTDQDIGAMAKQNAAMRKLDQQRFNARLQRGKSTQRDQQADAGEPPSQDMAPTAKEWVENNADWFEQDGEDYDERKAKRAIRLSNIIKKESGWDDDDPELYEELDARLNGRDNLEEEPEFRSARGGTSTGVTRGERAAKPSGNRLNAHDLQNMSRFGLDPKNLDHRKEYLENKGGV